MNYIEKFVRDSLQSRSYLFWMRKKGEKKRNGLEIAISVNISTGNMHVSAKFRSVLMPNVLKRILFAVGQRELEGDRIHL